MKQRSCVSDADLIAINEQHDTKIEAARSLGWPISTYKNRLNRALAAQKGVAGAQTNMPEVGVKGDVNKAKGTGWLEITDYEMPSEDQVLSKHNLDPACWRVTRVVPNQWQGFYRKGKRADAQHEVVTLFSLRIYVERIVPEPVEDTVKALASRIKPLPPPKPMKRVRDASYRQPQLGVLGLYDVHIGALAWEGETDQNNNTTKAVQRCTNAIDDLIGDLAPYNLDRLLVPIGNDFMHFDNERGETTSGNVQVDFDSRYAKVVERCHDVLCHLGDRCLEICDDVEFILVGGNHDRVTSLHFAHWMQQRYRDDMRVSVDTTMHARKYRRWQGVLLGFAHGDRINLKEIYRYMAEEAREDWANATCREFHFGDKHHRKEIDQKTLETVGKVTLRQNPSLSPRDRWTFYHGFDAVRCADAYRYSPHGFAGMTTAYARED